MSLSVHFIVINIKCVNPAILTVAPKSFYQFVNIETHVEDPQTHNPVDQNDPWGPAAGSRTVPAQKGARPSSLWRAWFCPFP